ncbi:MAG: HlyC/CorC family transporter [Leptospiraceae bacterium]|nr:HlyC/CorC family transporter [Leptospiraceae bacterium]
MEVFFAVFIIFFLVLINGFFVAAEFAMVSVRPTRVEELIKEGRAFATLTKKMIGKLNDMLSVCQVGITIASLLLGWLGEEFTVKFISYLFQEFNIIQLSKEQLHAISISISFSIITFMHITLGELIPKTIAIQTSEKIAFFSAAPMFFFYYLFYPITYFMNAITNWVLKLIGFSVTGHQNVHSAEEIMILLQEQNKQGKIDNEELRIIQKTFEFSEHEAKEVMTHRLSMVAISQDEKIKEILPVIAEHRFSRYPVYDKTPDHITGVVHVQAFIEWLANAERNKTDRVSSIMQPPVIVPETLSIEKVLQKLRKVKQHMAIVVDEYGGVSGLLTLEDIIEEVFGQIRDETDEEDPITVHDIKTDSYIIDGEAELDELNDVLEGEDIEHNKDVRTIAGFFMEKHEDMPNEGSTITIKSGTLTVVKMEGNKILHIKYDHKPMEIIPITEDYD